VKVLEHVAAKWKHCLNPQMEAGQARAHVRRWSG
jgi:hypothetical protein